jgi:hypothetical protein
MFTSEDIKARIKETPFVPLRLVTSSGQTYDITHPDLIMIGRRALMIGTASNEHPTEFETVSRVAILHVTDLQDLPQVKSSNNGAP